jgi:hypothetical protein
MAKINDKNKYPTSDNFNGGYFLGTDSEDQNKTVNYAVNDLVSYLNLTVSGKSAYEIAVEGGFEGSVDDWLVSLRGPEGLSAYEVAVGQNFQGTKDQWLASLVGASGTDGTNAQSFKYRGNVTNYESLPTSGIAVNDAFYNEADNRFYIYDGTSFPPVGKGFLASSAPSSFITWTSTNGTGLTEGSVRLRGDTLYAVKASQISSTTPPENDLTVWHTVGGKVYTVDTDLVFAKSTVVSPDKQVTATGTVANTGVTNVHGVSASIGVVPHKFDKITVLFAQNLATPVSQIEVRLFQGKTVGGTLIAKKRETITVGSAVQVSATLTFNTPIAYSGEMWIQVLMNNPFAYKRVNPAVARTAAAGYGVPTITIVNNLDGTSFPTAQGYTDFYYEFNKLDDIIVTTTTGTDVILSSFTQDVSTDITGNFTAANSYLDVSGNVIPSGNWRTSELIPVVSGNRYLYKGSVTQSTIAMCVVGYNSVGAATVLIPSEDHFATPVYVNIPAGIVNVRVCGFVSTAPTLNLVEKKIVQSLLPPSDTSSKIRVNKVWHSVGHSIWAQDGIVYPSTSTVAIGMQTITRNIYQFNGYNKYAYSGRSLGATAPTGDTLSITNYFNTWTDTSPGFWSIDTITNDFKRDIPIGTVNDYNNKTGVMTYYGALREFKDKVQSLTPVTTIFCFNALRRNNGGYTSTSTNAVGHKLVDYERALMTVAQLNGWIFIDQFRQSEITDETLDITTLDGLHPNNFGYQLAVRPWLRVLWIYLNQK